MSRWTRLQPVLLLHVTVPLCSAILPGLCAPLLARTGANCRRHVTDCSKTDGFPLEVTTVVVVALIDDLASAQRPRGPVVVAVAGIGCHNRVRPIASPAVAHCAVPLVRVTAVHPVMPLPFAVNCTVRLAPGIHRVTVAVNVTVGRRSTDSRYGTRG